MRDNAEINSHVIGPDDFLAASGFRFICELKEDSMRKQVPNQINEDWKVIEDWLGCKGRKLNIQDNDRIGRAWKSYCAIGIAPSLKLQPIFDDYSKQAKLERWEMVSLPSVVKDVFDRFLATDAEISEKKQAERQRLNQIFEQNKSAQQSCSGSEPKVISTGFFTKQRRIWIVGIATWVGYVLFRTSDYHEILGIELYRWDSSSLWINLLLPPVAVLVGMYLRKWILRGNK